MSRLTGLLDRIGSAASGARDRLMPEPQGMEGLLTDGDVRNARSQGLIQMGAGLLSSTSGGLGPLGDGLRAGQAGYNRSLAGTLEQREAGDELRQRQNLLQKKAMLAQRYPVGPNMTQDQMREMYVAYMQEGVELPPGLSEIIKSMEPQKPQAPIQIHAGGKTIVRDPQGIKPDEIIQHTPTPKDPREQSSEQTSAAMQRMFSREQQIGSMYIRETAKYADVANNFGTVAALADAARAKNPQAQIGLVFAFMKGLDPGSVVRESEYATAANAAGVPERVRNQYNKLLQGAFLSPQQVDGMIATSKSTAKMWQKRLAPTRQRYLKRANEWGVDGSFVTPDYFEAIMGAFGSSTTTPAGAAGSASNVRQHLKR